MIKQAKVRRSSIFRPEKPLTIEVTEFIVKGRINGEEVSHTNILHPIRLAKDDSLQLTWTFNGMQLHTTTTPNWRNSSIDGLYANGTK